jgi:hypothetical protein
MKDVWLPLSTPKQASPQVSGRTDRNYTALKIPKKLLLKSYQPVNFELLGKVYCKVDAQYSPVEVGDLLTTSPTPGYAMKAGDPVKALGAMIGKALRPLSEGQGLIPILIALQ